MAYIVQGFLGFHACMGFFLYWVDWEDYRYQSIGTSESCMVRAIGQIGCSVPLWDPGPSN